MTSDIVNAIVVEVPKPVRPELWIAVLDNGDKYRQCSNIYNTREEADKSLRRLVALPPSFYVRIPAESEQAPAAATRGADAVEELVKVIDPHCQWLEMSYDKSRGFEVWVKDGHVEDQDVCVGCGETYQAAAAACLAALKGA